MQSETNALRVLFVCTHNACRSILGEVIGNTVGDGALQCQSAGSNPSGKIHPDTLKHLRRHGQDTSGLASKGYDDVEAFDPDIVITVCDSAANEPCPAWLQTSAIRVHWGLKDPSHADGDESLRIALFDAVIDVLQRRLRRVSEHLRSKGAVGCENAETLRSLFAETALAEPPHYPD